MANRSRKRKSKQNSTNKALLIGLAGVLLVVLGGVLVFDPGKQAATTADSLPLEITVQEAYTQYEAGSYILDVRTPEEWIDGHVPGATLIPLDELANRLSELPQDEAIYVICRSGNRSATGRDILLQNGFEEVTSVGGGFNQWTANGFPVETGP